MQNCQTHQKVNVSTPTLERINPLDLDQNNSIDLETYNIHLERYAFASQHLVKGNILDVACGVGYGSYFLSNSLCEPYQIAAVDADKDAVSFALKNYNNSRIRYFVDDAYSYKPPFQISNIISLETLEHLENPELFISHAATFLKPGERFIVSVPITPSMDFNPYHLHDFTEKRLCHLFQENNFRLIKSITQTHKVKVKTIISTKNPRFKFNYKMLISFYLKNPDKLWQRIKSLFKDGFTNKYFIAVFEKVEY